ncbi:MAG: VWA domain-containing protein [Alphaproteobacteria bacterium]|nr:VWA domain-containing protein [Alphaproteobacteria bacterium]
MELFVWPFVFLLLPLPFFIRALFPYADNKSDTQTPIIALRVPFYQQIVGLSSGTYQTKVKIVKWPLIWAWIFCLCAVARPVWYDDGQMFPQNARNIVLALDTSGSMNETDFNVQNQPVTRLDIVKSIVHDFVQKRMGDEISLIIFGSEAYTYTPLTYDYKVIQSLLQEVFVGIAGELTAIGDALAMSVANAVQVPAQSSIVILLSDGYANTGSVQVEEAIRMAQKNQVKVYTVGIGSAPRQTTDFFGLPRIVNPSADLDEKTLTQIAQKTGGQYFRATTADELKEIYQTIDSLEKSQKDEQPFRPRKELFFLPLLLSMICFFIAWYKRRFR